MNLDRFDHPLRLAISVGDTCGSSRRAGQGDGTLAERLREAISSRLVRRGEPADPASVAIIRARYW
jgi:hypothetical protein